MVYLLFMMMIVMIGKKKISRRVKGAEKMTRELLLEYICPSDFTDVCILVGCEHCEVKLNEWLDEYDKHVIEQYKDIHDSVANEMYCKGVDDLYKADTNLKDTIREIHDNVAKEMYCKGIDDLTERLKDYFVIPHDARVIEMTAEQLKEQNK